MKTIAIITAIALTSCVTTETTDAKGGITRTRRMDTEVVRIIAPLVVPQVIPMPQVDYSK